MPAAIKFPKPKPMLKVGRLNSQRQMRRRETTWILRRPSSLARPEFRDVRQVRRPILNARIEDGTKHSVLPHIDIKRLDESEDSFVPAQAVVKFAGVVRHTEASNPSPLGQGDLAANLSTSRLLNPAAAPKEIADQNDVELVLVALNRLLALYNSFQPEHRNTVLVNRSRCKMSLLH